MRLLMIMMTMILCIHSHSLGVLCVCIIICLPHICAKEQPLIHNTCVWVANIGSVARDNVLWMCVLMDTALAYDDGRICGNLEIFPNASHLILSLSFPFHTYRPAIKHCLYICPRTVQTHVRRVQMWPLPGIRSVLCAFYFRPPALFFLLWLCPSFAIHPFTLVQCMFVTCIRVFVCHPKKQDSGRDDERNKTEKKMQKCCFYRTEVDLHFTVTRTLSGHKCRLDEGWLPRGTGCIVRVFIYQTVCCFFSIKVNIFIFLLLFLFACIFRFFIIPSAHQPNQPF